MVISMAQSENLCFFPARQWKLTGLYFLIFLLAPACSAWAGLEHLAQMIGVLPRDIALAGAAADGFPDPAAAYHNPAALADLPSTTMSMGYLYAQPNFLGGPAGKERSFNESNRVFSMNMGMDIGKLFLADYPIAMSINMLSFMPLL